MLVERHRGALRISACNRIAAANHLKTGMMLTEARAWLPGLIAQTADPDADRRWLCGLAQTCEIFTPLVALDGPDGLLLDITGCAHLFGDEAGLYAQVGRRLGDLGMTTRAAIAGTPDAARAFARFSQARIVSPESQEAMARNLPIAAVSDGPLQGTALVRAGLRTLGDLIDRPSATLAARFGAGLVDRLLRVSGRIDLRLTPLRVPPRCMAEKHFAEPVTAIDSLLATLEKLARDIVALLEKYGAGGRTFEIGFFRSDGTVRHLEIETAKGTRDITSLMRLFLLRIETLADPLDPGFGFDALRLAVTRSEVLDPVQKPLDDTEREEGGPDAIAELVARLVTRFGHGRVLRFQGHDRHDPAAAAAVAPYLTQKPAQNWPAAEAGQVPARPLTLFRIPQPIEALAEVPDGPPLRFRWRRVLHEVARAEGPERIAPEWWQPRIEAQETREETRDYYRIEDRAGRRFWIFREGLHETGTRHPGWFVHGLFA